MYIRMSSDFFYKCINRLNRLYLRRLLLVFIDTFIIYYSIKLCFWLANISLSESNQLQYEWLYASSILISIPYNQITNLYKGLTRYTGSNDLYILFIRNIVFIIIVYLVGFIFNYSLPSFNFWFSYFILISVFICFCRILFRDILLNLRASSEQNKTRVAIYGAGSTGSQLATSLKLEGSHVIDCFIDDQKRLRNRRLNRVMVISPKDLVKNHRRIDKFLIAIPSLNVTSMKKIVENLQKYGRPIFKVPSLVEISKGTHKINQFQEITIEDLLGREVIEPLPNLMGPGIKKKVVCVIGAGGSIGSEICRQVASLDPVKLIVLDNTEVNLYTIYKELGSINNKSFEILPILFTATDENFLNRLFEQNRVDVIFHAAAYKHVPLVEENPLGAIYNNVFSTFAVCNAAMNSNVENLIYISTDKAVRPTNVMGASKRLSEMIVQAFAKEIRTNKRKNKCFSMVRFGNVLNSSGSVVRLFTEQIQNGGPVTVTHPEIVRYFMTIKEAAQLVIQSSVIAKGGEVFLLNMGEPIKILHLAEIMIKLSGNQISNSSNKPNCIEIKFTGLRQGEKLYEELLINDDAKKTVHNLIYQAIENCMEPSELWPKLREMNDYIEVKNEDNVLRILSELVKEWEPSKNIRNNFNV